MEILITGGAALKSGDVRPRCLPSLRETVGLAILHGHLSLREVLIIYEL